MQLVKAFLFASAFKALGAVAFYNEDSYDLVARDLDDSFEFDPRDLDDFESLYARDARRGSSGGHSGSTCGFVGGISRPSHMKRDADDFFELDARDLDDFEGLVARDARRGLSGGHSGSTGGSIRGISRPSHMRREIDDDLFEIFAREARRGSSGGHSGSTGGAIRGISRPSNMRRDVEEFFDSI